MRMTLIVLIGLLGCMNWQYKVGHDGVAIDEWLEILWVMVLVGANEYILWPYHFRCGSHDSAAVVGSLWDEQVKLCCPDDWKDLFSTP